MNLIIFPDWLESEDLINLELVRVIKTLAINNESCKTNLLIDTTNISPEDAELFLSSVTINLLFEEDIDVTDSLEISFVENLVDIQWETLPLSIDGRIILEYENQEALRQAKAETLASYKLESFNQVKDQEFFFA